MRIAQKLLVPALVLMAVTDLGSSSAVQWRALAPGLELTSFKAVQKSPKEGPCSMDELH